MTLTEFTTKAKEGRQVMNFLPPFVTLVDIGIDHGQLEEEQQQRTRIEYKNNLNVIKEVKKEEYIALLYSGRAFLTYSYWRHHGTFLNIRTAVRPSDDVCKSDKLNSGIRRLILQSFPEMEENSEELADIFSWN